MTSQIALRTVAATVLALLAFAPVASAAQSPAAERAAIKAYWTTDRMANAVPRGLAKGKPGGGGSSATYTRSAVTNPLVGLNRTNGKVFMTFGRTNYVCSGTSIQSGNDSLVWTAGHCVFEKGTAKKPIGYATNFLFVPAYDTGSEPLGRFAAATADLRTTDEYEASESFAYDVGAAKVGTSGGSSLAGVAGERPILFSATDAQLQTDYVLYGYPVSSATGNGQRMWQCDTTFAAFDTSLTPPSIGVACNWPGGSSGGAWTRKSDGTLLAATSYGYSGVKDRIYASRAGASAAALYAAMQG